MRSRPSRRSPTGWRRTRRSPRRSRRPGWSRSAGRFTCRTGNASLLDARSGLEDHPVPAMRALLLASVLTLVLAAAAAASLAPRVPLNEANISAAQCTPPGSGANVVVDVTFRLKNWADAGYAAQWAIDDVKRHLTIWRHSDGTYCAVIDDDGSTFITRAG